MDTPYTFRLEQFEGPLELLLRLIEEEKLDITTISLATVTDQYLSYLEHEEQLPPDEVADFLVVAAQLIYIKSKYLLPSLELEAEDTNLEEQLKIYREYYDASKVITQMIGRKRFAYVRDVPLTLPQEQRFSPPKRLRMEQLAAALRSVIGRLEVIIKLPTIVLKNTVSIREKIQALREALKLGVLNFHAFYDRSNKQDIIVSFLALLELVKLRDVRVQQDRLFSEIVITPPHDV